MQGKKMEETEVNMGRDRSKQNKKSKRKKNKQLQSDI